MKARSTSFTHLCATHHAEPKLFIWTSLITIKGGSIINGVFGKFLYIDLTSEKITDYKIPEEWYEKYLGGRGVAARILIEELEKNQDPLGPENVLVFATGPLQGTGIPGAGRHLVMAKSPKTKSVSDSYAGGFFGHELGTSGYDGIIIKGKANSPKYLSLIEGEAEIEDAEDLWGMEVAKTEAELKKRHGGGSVSSIGIAGENLVKFACIMNDRNRAAGRPGFGAVMGSKNLKAVIVRGSGDKPVFDKNKLKEARSKFVRKLVEKKFVEEFGKLGSTAGLMFRQKKGMLPTKNFQKGIFEKAEKISGERMYDEILVGRDTCAGCPIRCKRVVKTEFKGESVDEKYGGPEYETLAAFGSLCMNDNLDSIALANQKCNKYGLDTISTGCTIAFAMEAAEKGLIDINLKWGDPEAIVSLIDKIANRDGIGDILAKGIASVAEEIGANFAMVVKGQEIPMHEPRGEKSMALSYATSPRGATHLDTMVDVLPKHPSELKIKGNIDCLDLGAKPEFCKVYDSLVSFIDSAILCFYTTCEPCYRGIYVFPEVREMIEAVTGRPMDVEEMMTIGERNHTLLKLLSAKEGISRKQDKLPERFEEPLREGPISGESIPRKDLQEKIDEYYALKGWGDYGPTPEKLKELGMSELKRLVKS